jgi:hypothetical protein
MDYRCCGCAIKTAAASARSKAFGLLVPDSTVYLCVHCRRALKAVSLGSSAEASQEIHRPRACKHPRSLVWQRQRAEVSSGTPGRGRAAAAAAQEESRHTTRRPARRGAKAGDGLTARFR